MLKDTIKKVVPAPVLNAGKNAYDAVKRLGDIPEAYFSAER